MRTYEKIERVDSKRALEIRLAKRTVCSVKNFSGSVFFLLIHSRTANFALILHNVVSQMQWVKIEKHSTFLLDKVLARAKERTSKRASRLSNFGLLIYIFYRMKSTVMGLLYFTIPFKMTLWHRSFYIHIRTTVSVFEDTR